MASAPLMMPRSENITYNGVAYEYTPHPQSCKWDSEHQLDYQYQGGSGGSVMYYDKATECMIICMYNTHEIVHRPLNDIVSYNSGYKIARMLMNNNTVFYLCIHAFYIYARGRIWYFHNQTLRTLVWPITHKKDVVHASPVVHVNFNGYVLYAKGSSQFYIAIRRSVKRLITFPPTVSIIMITERWQTMHQVSYYVIVWDCTANEAIYAVVHIVEKQIEPVIYWYRLPDTPRIIVTYHGMYDADYNEIRYVNIDRDIPSKSYD